MKLADIVDREDWGADPPRARKLITTPTPEVWLHHTATDQHGAAGVRAIQSFHMSERYGRGWHDIAYSFLVDDADQTVYEGRGFGARGAHTPGHNGISHAICVIGNFASYEPSPETLATVGELVAFGYQRGEWPRMLSGGHRDVTDSTSCPGKFLYRRIGDINAAAEGDKTVSGRGSAEGDGMASGYCEHGDENWNVGVVQRKIQDIDAGALPDYGADEIYGDELASELVRILAEHAGWGTDWDGRRLTTNAAAALDGAHARAWSDV